MKSQWFPHDYAVDTHFPDRTLVWKGGMEGVYAVAYEGKPSLLYDGRAAFGFLVSLSIPLESLEGDVDDEALEKAFEESAADTDNKECIQLIVFETMEERMAYLEAKYPQTPLHKWLLEKYK